MELRKCPVCGGKLRSEALGWICYDCQGFIDMQGVFHEHIEKPFMPPMTNADRIREMSDEELADYFGDCLCPREINCSGPCDACIMEWLSKPAEE